MTTIPNLSISPEKVFFVISKSRQSDSGAAGGGVILESGDDDLSYGRGGRGEATDRAELSGFIRDLNMDEQIDLVALMWLGRGDGDVDEWDDLRDRAIEARAEYKAPRRETVRYLLGEPMLGDLLADGMDKLGIDWSDERTTPVS